MDKLERKFTWSVKNLFFNVKESRTINVSQFIWDNWRFFITINNEGDSFMMFK